MLLSVTVFAEDEEAAAGTSPGHSLHPRLNPQPTDAPKPAAAKVSAPTGSSGADPKANQLRHIAAAVVHGLEAS